MKRRGIGHTEKGKFPVVLRSGLIGIVFLVLFLPKALSAQTCSCAAAPLFTPLDFSLSQNKKWHFELSYKHHAINDLVEGSKRVEDDSERQRTAQSLLLDIRYALARRLTLRAVFSLSRQHRNIGISASPPTTTQGIGDSLLAVQYALLPYSPINKTAVSVGIGWKVPMGESGVRVVGIASEDMQPGTGSWDFLIWGAVIRSLPKIDGLDVFAGFSTRFNGVNQRDYRFGKEVTLSLGAKLNTGTIFDPAFLFKYRWAGGDERFNSVVPNTGGQWIYIVPTVTARFSQDLGIKTEVEIPVFRKLKGFRQFTSTFLISASFFVEF